MKRVDQILFETEREVLDWYERQPRALTSAFVDSINWIEMRRNGIDQKFVPILVYMRDIEHLTGHYFRELRLTPTGRDRIVRRFMDRWSVEESQHGELLNRVLQITGVEGGPDWQQRLKREIPFSYRLSSLAGALISNPFGSHFATAHMVWGTINELTTLQAYRRLWELAANPVLTRLLKAIAQEESVHVTFYWHIARLKLARSVLSRKFSRKIIECFWAPVGSGIRPADGLDHLVRTLFSSEGTQSFERGVHDRINRLPGFSSFEKVRNRLLSIVNDPTIESAGVL